MKVYKVEAARKDYPEAGIVKGQEYYWWKFRGCKPSRSATYPTPDQLSKYGPSEFATALAGLVETMGGFNTPEALKEGFAEWKAAIEELRDETQEKFDNVSQYFQGGNSYEILEARVDGLTEWLDALEEIEAEIDGYDPEEDEDGEAGDELLESFGNVSPYEG